MARSTPPADPPPFAPVDRDFEAEVRAPDGRAEDVAAGRVAEAPCESEMWEYKGGRCETMIQEALSVRAFSRRKAQVQRGNAYQLVFEQQEEAQKKMLIDYLPLTELGLLHLRSVSRFAVSLRIAKA